MTLTQRTRLIDVDGPKLGYVSTFDGMRGLFVLQVVLYHAEVTIFLAGSPILIDLFFVLSGFLITHLLLDEFRATQAISLRRFYMRRVLRLFPAMYALIALFTLLMLAVQFFGPPEAREALSSWWLEALGAATYTYFILAAFFPTAMGVLGPIWTLSLEECFYLLWPPTIRRALRRGSLRSDALLVGAGLVFIAICFTARARLQFVVGSAANGAAVYMDTLGGLGTGLGATAGSQATGYALELPQYGATWQGIAYRLFATRPDMIVWGCLMAVVVKSIPRPVPERIRRLLAVGGVIGWIMLGATVLFASPGPPGPLALFGGLLYQASLIMLGPIVLDAYLRQDAFYLAPFRWGWTRWLGERSYGIYLWHAIVLPICAPAILAASGPTRRVLGLVASAIAVGVGILSYRFLERRFLRLKDLRFANPGASPR
ncbi:MAG: acyltransferase [Microthrixaceae bacterium]|nr:acyltransferase [Microthrixaceae bacterium]